MTLTTGKKTKKKKKGLPAQKQAFENIERHQSWVADCE